MLIDIRNMQQKSSSLSRIEAKKIMYPHHTTFCSTFFQIFTFKTICINRMIVVAEFHNIHKAKYAKLIYEYCKRQHN